MPRRLLFVYNADAGPWHTALDIAHKLFSPETYACSLCRLTHGALREREAWRRYRETSGDELHFYHRDEFERRFGPTAEPYPLVLEARGDDLKVVLSAAEIAAQPSLEALIERLGHL